MSFLSSIGSALSSVGKGIMSVVSPMLPAIGTAVGAAYGGPAGAAMGGQLGGAFASKPPATTAGTAAGGVLQSVPFSGAMSGGRNIGALGLPTVTGAPSPGAPGGFLQGIVTGMTRAAGGGMTATKRGKLTGNAIPRGYVEKMSPQGVVYLGKIRRRRGITSRDLSSFYRVQRLVSKIRTPHHRRGK